MASSGNAWTKAAVFRLNIGMSGTPSMVISVRARSTVSWCGSVKVPVVAYTSIIGTGFSSLSMAPFRLSNARRTGRTSAPASYGGERFEDQSGRDVGPGDEGDVRAVHGLGHGVHPLSHEAIAVRRDRIVALGHQDPTRKVPPADG